MIDVNGTVYQDLTRILVTREEIAAKVNALMDKVQSIVEERAGVHLEPEIRVLGEEA